MDGNAWISEVLLDMAAFAEENNLPKTYDALIKAMAVTSIEAQQNGRLKQKDAGNVIALLERGNIKFAKP